jgi:hypothetical protein
MIVANERRAFSKALPPSVTFGDIWFNGFEHLVPRDQLGVAAGERLSKHLTACKRPWNKQFQGNAVAVEAGGALPSRDLDGGLKLIVLSPTRDRLRALHKVWKSVLKKSGMATDALGEISADETESEPSEAPDRLGRSDKWPPDVAALAKQTAIKDTAQANGSSIGLLAEYQEGDRHCAVLLGADCFASVLETTIQRLLKDRKLEHLRLDAFKLPHHGSRFNLNNSLLSLLKCSRYLISTSGARFRHPDHETVGAILEAMVQILDREGVEAATMAHIAEVAGVSVGSIYQYYSHRDAILNALQDREFARSLWTVRSGDWSDGPRLHRFNESLCRWAPLTPPSVFLSVKRFL